MKKADFALDFCCLDAVSLRDKENNEKKPEELGDRQYFSVFLLLQQFSSPFLLGFIPGFLGISWQGSQLDK